MAGVYVLGGVTMVSELALPELIAVQPESVPLHPVTIRVGQLPRELPGAVALDAGCFATPSTYLLHIDGIASYLVVDGREIVVSPAPDAVLLDVRAYLLGMVFVVLCQQRGLLPLHASAVLSSRGVVAFVGQSGQGKSSLAAHLAERGYAVMADDICLIDPADMMVSPTAPWLKLWRASLERLGKDAEPLARVFSEEDKYRLPLLPVSARQRLGMVVFLEEDASAVEVRIDALSPLEAVPRLMRLTHQAYVLEATGQREQSFRHCSRVASLGKAYRLVRPWGLEYLQATVDAVEAWLRG